MLHPHFQLHHQPPTQTGCAVALEGELDISSVSTFRSALGELMGAGQRDIRIDMSDVDFLDSCGIGVLLWAHHRLESAGGRLTVVNASGDVARVLELTGTARLLLDAPLAG